MSISSFFIVNKSGGMIYKFLKQEEGITKDNSTNRNDKSNENITDESKHLKVTSSENNIDKTITNKTEQNKDELKRTNKKANANSHTQRASNQNAGVQLCTTNLNNLLVLNSTLHTIHQMASTIYGQSQKFYIYFTGLTLTMFKTMTGYTFIFVGDEKASDKLVYDVYKEFNLYVLRNPAYMDDMPINLCTFKPNKYF
ncbi:Transport protein particle (TRAPP) complex subunit [Trachipleistophora hominis]|uniref:Trafficking protein particle complex subunit n=1 Tax=Trachipleistophora hominis TaxID=72359 RepID=L7JS23_TRAHO|nr:Transport protein particle (TRAPP) complex subunit [Trachipleistophora hominis]